MRILRRTNIFKYVCAHCAEQTSSSTHAHIVHNKHRQVRMRTLRRTNIFKYTCAYCAEQTYSSTHAHIVHNKHIQVNMRTLCITNIFKYACAHCAEQTSARAHAQCNTCLLGRAPPSPACSWRWSRRRPSSCQVGACMYNAILKGQRHKILSSGHKVFN